jgi:hypothetical protein
MTTLAAAGNCNSVCRQPTDVYRHLVTQGMTARQGPPFRSKLQLLPPAALQVEASAFERVRESLARRYRNANMRPEQVGRSRTVTVVRTSTLKHTLQGSIRWVVSCLCLPSNIPKPGRDCAVASQAGGQLRAVCDTLSRARARA